MARASAGLGAAPPAGESVAFRPWVISIFVATVTVLAFARTGGHSFINYDDHVYVIDNARVTTGLALENILWAFRSGYAANWHPLTWISHMVDCELFGLNPGPHHLVNVAWHAVSAVLLFLALARATQCVYRSGLVAMLFALHPTHVESVAWISERKDVLSAAFWFATMLAYVHYTARMTPARYAAVAGFFVCGLLSKPMTVTLPCVLLLMDFWPLNRIASRAQLLQRLLEKVPLAVLAAVASVITFQVQNAGGAVAEAEGGGLFERMARAVMSYVFYLRKTFWPEGLIIPYWTEFPLGAVAVGSAAMLLVLISFAALKFGRRFGYLPVGWFWFLGTLVPVIGLVRVGSQSAADRYTYIPSVGIFILAVWLAGDLCRRWRVPRMVVMLTAAALLAACVLLTHRQVGYWKNSETLFQRTLAVDPANLLAVGCLAWTYATDLDPALRNGPQALNLALVAVQLTERREPVFLNTLAAAHAELGQFDLALRVSEEALRLAESTQPALATEIRNSMQHYRAGRAIHQPMPDRVIKAPPYSAPAAD